jgi:hypothetical protein
LGYNNYENFLAAYAKVIDVEYTSFTITGITNGTVKAKSFSLEQNYPNPFNPSTTISYSIPKPSYVELKVFNMLGREISTLVNKEQQAGSYKTQFDGSSLPSGIYVYTIKAGEFRSSKKLMLIK